MSAGGGENALLTTVAITSSGPVCGHCSHGTGSARVLVRHGSAHAIWVCFQLGVRARAARAAVDRVARASGLVSR